MKKNLEGKWNRNFKRKTINKNKRLRYSGNNVLNN
jgi:hypothetical protein